jgi:hypothetical protein
VKHVAVCVFIDIISEILVAEVGAHVSDLLFGGLHCGLGGSQLESPGSLATLKLHLMLEDGAEGLLVVV